MQINNRKIGSNQPSYVIAEMSANHNGDINNAYKIIDMALHKHTPAQRAKILAKRKKAKKNQEKILNKSCTFLCTRNVVM
jgi:sialic acid synthase SpsE